MSALVSASIAVAGLSGMAADRKAVADPSPANSKAPGVEVDTAITRLRELGAFVREFHPRDHPEYWVQIISTGLGAETRKEAENIDDAALRAVEIIGRGVTVHLHLRETSVTSAGLGRLASAGNIQVLELSGNNVDDALLKILPKLLKAALLNRMC
jgi:hypothetical protein